MPKCASPLCPQPAANGLPFCWVHAGLGGGSVLAPPVPGVAPDAPIVTAPNGGQQSHTPYRFDLIPPEALFVVARIFDYGAHRYTPNNWRKLGRDDHLNHAAEHLYAALQGDTQDDHLGHLAVRSLMALAVALGNGYQPRQGDEHDP